MGNMGIMWRDADVAICFFPSTVPTTFSRFSVLLFRHSSEITSIRGAHIFIFVIINRNSFPFDFSSSSNNHRIRISSIVKLRQLDPVDSRDLYHCRINQQRTLRCILYALQRSMTSRVIIIKYYYY